MLKTGIFHPQLLRVLGEIRHKDLLVIGDAGLPIPKGVPVIDLSLVRGIPSFLDVLHAVREELVIESYFVASEMETVSGALYQKVREELPGLPESRMPHEDFKKALASAQAVIRTGETTSYANIALVAGVNF